MKPPTTRAYLLTPESVASTDIVLNLFIFFFVSFSILSTFSPERLARLEVTLPRASSAGAGSETAVVVTVTREGQYSVGDRAIEAGRLPEELAAVAAQRASPPIVVRADAAAPCRCLVAVFDAARGAGITRVSFAVQRLPSVETGPSSAGPRTGAGQPTAAGGER